MKASELAEKIAATTPYTVYEIDSLLNDLKDYIKDEPKRLEEAVNDIIFLAMRTGKGLYDVFSDMIHSMYCK